MERYEPVHIEDDHPAFVRIHANTEHAYGCIAHRDGVVVFMAHVVCDELREGVACLDDALEVLRQALAAEPAMIEAVVGHLQTMKVRRMGRLEPVLGPVDLLRWVASIKPSVGDHED